MEDWQIALMVVICVVFVILATILIFLICRYWNGVGTVGKRSRMGKGEDDSRSSSSIVYYPGCQPRDDVLYFLDFAQQLHAIHLKSQHIVSGQSLQQAVAQAAGVTDRIDTLSLAASYASNGVRHPLAHEGRGADAGAQVGAAYMVGDATVELDLDRLVAPDAQRAARMRQTAERPLLLHRLVEVTVDGEGTHSVNNDLSNPFGMGNAVGYAAYPSRGANTIDVSIARQQQQQQQNNFVQWQQGEGGNATAGHKGTQHGQNRSDTASVAPSHVAGIFQNPITPRALPPVTSVPSPIIFPSKTSHITAATPVFVMAAHYYVCVPSPATSGAAQTPFNQPQQQQQQQQQQWQTPLLIDEATTALLEAAMCGETSSKRVFVAHGAWSGSTFAVNPREGTATLYPSPSAMAAIQQMLMDLAASVNARNGGVTQMTPSPSAEYLVVRRKADVIRYCLDGAVGEQWRLFEKPILLPPGRWCVRAKVSSVDGKFTDTAAKVFSVSVPAV